MFNKCTDTIREKKLRYNKKHFCKMKKSTITIIAIVGVLAVIVLWGIGVNNKLVTQEENVSKAWSNVENVYKRRMDLIPQLVNTV